MPRKEDIRKFTNLPFQGVKNSGNQLNISLSGLAIIIVDFHFATDIQDIETKFKAVEREIIIDAFS